MMTRPTEARSDVLLRIPYALYLCPTRNGGAFVVSREFKEFMRCRQPGDAGL